MTVVKHEPTPYDGKIGSPSLFRDLYTLQLAEQRRRAAIDDPFLKGRDPGEASKRGWPTVEQAAARLNGLGRDLTSGAAGTALNPKDMPPAIADMFAAFNHPEGVIPSVLPTHSIPGMGMTLRLPRATSGATAAVQATQNSTVSNTDPVYDEVESNISTVAGSLTGSLQLFDLSTTNPDIGIASELGAAMGAKLDQELLTGTGTGGRTTGLLTATGVNAVTAASGSVEDTWQAIGKAYQDVSVSSGAPPDLVLVHPRREAQLRLDTITNQRPTVLPGNLQIVGVPAIGVTSGTGTNEDRIVVMRRNQTPLFLGTEQVRFSFDGAVSGTGSWRLTAYRYFSLMPERRPESIAVISGCTPPAW